jgi:protein TonB
MDLINRGKVYRFLLKPVSPGRARLAVEASVKHHLEAPDSAFKTSGKAAAAPQKPRTRPEPKKADAAKPAPAKPKAAPAEKPRAASSITASKSDSLAVSGSGLDDAFGDDANFTETMTGIVSTVTKSIAGRKKDKEQNREAAAASGDSGDTSSSLSPKWLGIGAAAVVAIAVVGFWVFGGSDEAGVSAPRPTATTSVNEDAPGLGSSIEQPAVDIDELLEEARLARDAGQIFNPPGNNAIEFYVAAVSADPDNAYAAAELDATLDEALTMAETALLEHRAEDAVAALERVRGANPEHPRLPFLTAQVSQMQLRDYMDSARTAIRDNRLEDASSAIADARALGVADDGEIEAVEQELLNVRSERRVDEVLALAGQRLDEGALTSPANDNARYYYQLALSNDPGSAAAQTGLTVVASKIVLQARAEIDGGRFSTAEALLAERREAEKRAEEERQAAEREAEQQRATEAATAAAAAVAATASAADAAQTDTDATDAAEPVAEESVAPQAAEATAEPAQQATTEPVPASQQMPVAASTLKRTKYVAPRYPRSAERRNISGWVDVVFTVKADGSVTDVEVVGSDPGDMFVDSATKAVEKWEFEPVVEDGQIVEKRAGVRMMFAIE